jgi:hypothetical protein
MDVRDAVSDDALDLLLDFGSSRLIHRVSLLPDRLARSLTGAGIGASALSAQREPTTMAQTAIAAQVHQTLDADTDFAAQIAFDHVFSHFGAQALDFGFGQVTNLGAGFDPGVLADLLGPGPANAENALEAHPDVFLDGKIDTRNARH